MVRDVSWTNLGVSCLFLVDQLAFIRFVHFRYNYKLGGIHDFFHIEILAWTIKTYKTYMPIISI